VHPWHTDIESSATAGTALSVWIGLEHTDRDSSLLVVPHSHDFGVSVQEVRNKHGRSRAEVTDADVTRWARERDGRSGVMKAEITDGEALFFDGRLWHGSYNGHRETRRAVLLQYATPDTPIHIPDFNYLDWPFRRFLTPRPPCVMISGSARASDNRIVPPPSVVDGSVTAPRLSNRVYPLRTPLVPPAAGGWKPYYIFHGCTANVSDMTCHASVLTENQSPHPPHRHDEDEILMLLTGEADLILPDFAASGSRGRLRLQPGEFVYYPPQFPHTLQTVNAAPANYLMFKWRNSATPPAGSPLGFRHARPMHEAAAAQAAGLSTRALLDGHTSSLSRLECHMSTLAPGAGYDAHVDAHDVGIVVLDGEIETLGQRVGPHAVVFHPGGELHGIYNPGHTAARYLVIEFHRGGTPRSPRLGARVRSLVRKVRDPERWKRKARRLWARVAG
jgi:uncharacterized RmlC-like cupin family protein